MNKPWEVINLLEEDNSRLVKENILKHEVLNNNTELFEGFKLALDASVTFGVKKVEEKTNESGSGLAWDKFVSSTRTLIDRTCTGNAARDLITEMMNQATTEQWNNWYRRILIKDLRCGVSEKTINKVVKHHANYSIPRFTCQLAHDSANHESKVSGKKLLEVKLDGVQIGRAHV